MIAFSDPRHEQDLATVLAKRVAQHPDKPWVVTDEATHSYRDIDERSSRLAGGFADAGVAAPFLEAAAPGFSMNSVSRTARRKTIW